MFSRSLTIALSIFAGAPFAYSQNVSIATYQVDVTPLLGSPLCGGAVLPAQVITDPLTARGVILLPEGQQPVVLCAVDWVGIANSGHDEWRNALAEAAGTDASRVAVHTLHQHDAPFCDFDTEALIDEQGMGGRMFNVPFARECMERAAAAVREAKSKTTPVTHVGVGQAEVEKVASNRRVLGPDGTVLHTRWTATKDPEVRAFPVGTIDPMVQAVSFWNGDEPLVVMTYYATHPQSHYGQGAVSADFPGMARSMREEALPGVKHIHFNGAGGNVTAGKWNDGSPENRPVLAGRLADGMKRAWESTSKTPVSAADIGWTVDDVALPPRAEVTLEDERARLADASLEDNVRLRAAREVALLERHVAGKKTTIALLKIGPVRILHMPGELFIEYQLAAQAMLPERPVCMAAYGDYGPGYIGTTVSYGEGGYETGLYVSRTAPSVEEVLLGSLQRLLSD
ncbi:MAG: hypothetical protein KJ060_15370 [Candidatus Hydrogenedentes bacterium]|nr:hypothetical protein [Candidatus Hydrogenedentota bacterium]